jgi:predicted ABC-type ATPase
MTDSEKLLKNLTLEIQTIDVLVQHLARDLTPAHPSAAQVNAARHLAGAIQRIVETYR